MARRRDREPGRPSIDVTSFHRPRDSNSLGGSGAWSDTPEGAGTADLLSLFRGGDPAAYEVLFKRYHEALLRFVRCHTDRFLRGQVSEEDLVQEVHLKALRAVEGFQYTRELSFFFWLCAIARNLITDHYRRLQRRPPPVSLHAGAGPGCSSLQLIDQIKRSGASPLDELGRQENLHMLAAGLETLEEKRRRAIVLKFVEGRDNAEAAEVLGMSNGAFRVLVYRALGQLRQRLAALLGEEDTSPGRSGDSSWRRPSTGRSRSSVFRRIYEADPLLCTCGAPMRVLSFLTEPPVIRKILDHLASAGSQAARAPPRRELEPQALAS